MCGDRHNVRMEQKYDFHRGPEKVFIERVHVRILNGLLHFALESGDKAYAFTSDLVLGKRFSRIIQQQVEEIEKKNNIVIDGRLPHEPMPSPLSVSDIQGGAKGEKK